MKWFKRGERDRVALGSRTETETVTAPSAPNTDFTTFTPSAHTFSPSDIWKSFNTSRTDGLSRAEAFRRLQRYGENMLEGQVGVSALRVLLAQITNALTLVLLGALALSFGVRDWVEGSVIAAVILLNTVVGFMQEYRAEKTMDSLRQLSSPTGLVIRNGESITVPAKFIVPGDVIMLQVGDVVPADIRLLTASNLEVSEQLLTGESVPVVKTVETYPDTALDLPVGDRLNLCYSSTVVTAGRGSGVAIGTGMNTQVGRIARAMQRKKKPRITRSEGGITRWRQWYELIMTALGLRIGTPLQIKLSKLAYTLFLCAALLVIIVFAVSRFKVTNEVAIYGIATAIAIIPESLVAVLTLSMAVGTRRMAERNVIVRKLDALENLGAVTDICSDKTGTLTIGQMSVRKLWLAGDGDAAREYTAEMTKDPLVPTGAVTEETTGSALDPGKLDEGIVDAVKVASLCNTATVHQNLRMEWKSTGNPTEVALAVFVGKLGLERPSLVVDRQDEAAGTVTDAEKPEVHFHEKQTKGSQRYTLRTEFLFSSDVKRMTMIYADKEDEAQAICVTKGATERVLQSSTRYVPSPITGPGVTAALSDPERQRFLAKAEELASQGLRVMGLAHRFIPSANVQNMSRDDVEQDAIFLGLVGIFDPPRLESFGAVRACREAGIVVHMLTGDHAATAKAIAQEVGILASDYPPSAVVTASDFDKLTDDEVDALPELPLVIARCEPDTKVKMIEAGKRRGKHLAMTGDGVNDAPALKLAPVGVAMGLAGSDVAKDAADLVLTDDNFDSIRAAVRDGRRLFLNIQRFILHLLSANVAEVVLLIVGLCFVDKDGTSVFPLAPLAVLWVNMITSGPPAFGLGLEEAPDDIMKRPPHSPKVGVFSWPVIIDTFSYGIVMGATTLPAFVIVVYGRYGGNLGHKCNRGPTEECVAVFRGRSTVFATLIIEILLYAIVLKSFERSMFSLRPGVPFWKDWVRNRALLWSILVGLGSVVLAIYVPGVNTQAFHQQAIGWEWGVVFGMTLLFILWCEVWKMMRGRIFKLLRVSTADVYPALNNPVP